MATWQEIGIKNFQAAQELYDGRHYRSSVSRFYYAAFSALTVEIARRGVVFPQNRETPSHAQLPQLIVRHLTQFSETRRGNIARVTARLYRSRLDADYSLTRVDKRSAGDALRDAAAILEYLGVSYDA